ncbi:MAG: FAD:protein FMN transferase [Desulfomonilia bacterium]|nr:FAD:protein FMN transferase [Desulfomonilia bacterium]HPW68722.1 FAD:protein FMN transferase [Deltaproteobacteria bacterium]
MKKTIAVFILLLLALGVSVWHRGSRGETRHATIFIMDTFVELMAQGSREQADTAFKDAIAELGRTDSRLGYQNSLIDELNSSHTLKDREIYCLLRLSREVHDASSGGFSITLRPILDAWGFTGGHPHRLPTKSEFAAWKRLPSDHAVILDPDGLTIRTPEGAEIDLGGIAKGYAADRAAEAMKNAGVSSGLVNAGGDIAAFGERTWKIGIKHPGGTGVFATIPVRNRAVATSGNYERFFTVDGIRYCHLLNPDTGMPARGRLSATVLADTCAEADAWVTALFVRGEEKLGEELEKRGMDWIVVDQEGRVHASKALREFCPENLPAPE